MRYTARTIVCIVLCLIAVRGGMAARPDLSQELRVLEKQRAALASAGLWGFLAEAQTNRWTAPKIHSQCWVDWLPLEQRDLRRLEQARRDFGLDMVKAIEREALLMLHPADGAERARQADRLLRFSKWAGEPGGYGNLAIQRRIEHLAYVPVGHLAADIDYPIEDVDRLLGRFESDSYWIRLQRDILNEESPNRYSARTGTELEQQWHSHFRRAALAFKEAKGRFPFNHAESAGLPNEVSFYIEDASTAPPRTLASQWGQKKHYLFCVRGKTDAIADRVRNLLLFRKTVGRFPEKPSRPLELFKGEEIREAFYEAWMPYESKFGKKGSGASRTYLEIQDNSFMDYDTQELVAGGAGK